MKLCGASAFRPVSSEAISPESSTTATPWRAIACWKAISKSRGACALVLIGAAPFLDAAYMQYDRPARLFMVSLVYVALALSIWLGAQPWRLRDFFNWLFAREARSRILGGLFVAYGIVLCGAAFGLR